MTLAEVEARVADLDLDAGFGLIFDLLLAYGLPQASVSRLRNGSYDKSEFEQEVLWKGKVFYRYEPSVEDDGLYGLIDATRTDERIERFRPRFLIVRNEGHLLAKDQVTGDTLDINLSDLPGRAEFFLPWAGIEKATVENASVADVKAAAKMAKLYDEIVRHNEIETATDTYNLNVFFSRLLFCFFAEDTGVFEPAQFSGRIASLTQDSGEDVSDFLDRLFVVLDTEPAERQDLPGHLADFGYVNGSLFSEHAPCPRFTAKARSLVIDCGTLDWAFINPDIFGSMIQAVVHPGERSGLGMHYTSVENIMKVLRPLFLDDLEADFAAAEDSPRKLRKLLDRITEIKVFDPACGSGNFLVIAYKELRKLEHRILGRLIDLKAEETGLFKLSRVKLDHFYGIEIDSFAHEIAMLSLWLAKHQMNLEFEELFGVELGLIPLKEGGQIVQGNATRMDWLELVQPESKTFILGNPPYLGGTRQSTENKEDLEFAFAGRKINKYLDYVSIWLYKSAEMVDACGARVGLVTTNSVFQGNHVGLLWPHLEDFDVQVSFAHAPFLWSNQARGQAGVTCSIVGLAPKSWTGDHTFLDSGSKKTVRSINRYLIPNAPDVIVHGSRNPLNGLPAMAFGSMPRDGGGLILTRSERDALCSNDPAAQRYIKSYVGSEEFINGSQRYCLWIDDKDRDVAQQIAGLSQRFDRVTASRDASSAASTKAFASQPHRFVQRAHRDGTSIIVPSVSSERREYIPMGFLDSGTVISNAANAIYNAEPWVFGLIQSRMHMAWTRAVAGRMKSDYRYSSVLVYNTFPVPELSEDKREALQAGAFGILDARARFAGKTLAELYDPDNMPESLRDAHRALDETVDHIYRKKPFNSDEERLEMLFALYSEMTNEDGDEHA